MITSPGSKFMDRIAQYADTDSVEAGTVAVNGIEVPTITVNENRLFVFCSTNRSTNVKSFKEALLSNEPQVFKNESLFEIVVSVSGIGCVPERDQIFGRGKRILGFHDATAKLLGMPEDWQNIQSTYIHQALEPLKLDNEVRLADLYLRVDGQKKNALPWLTDRLGSWKKDHEGTLYLRAEAGKGKSTLLAETTRRISNNSDGPLPLYIPLRNLKRESGISWEGIAACTGIVGRAADKLRSAVRVGLVSLLLDGLDEVAGRYDPSTIQQVEEVVLSNLKAPGSRIVLSGRTTEATLLDNNETLDTSIELPGSDDKSFKKYAGLVIDSITPKWPSIQPNIDSLSFQSGTTDDQPPSKRQRSDILEWVKVVFDDLGKEKSLFFIQSLACIGRSYQSESQPFLIRGQDQPAQLRPPLLDVCLLAAGLACFREQKKIEDIGHGYFGTQEQIQILTLLALLASAEDTLRNQLPRPNEIAKRAVGVDPINENEAFTAVTRQLQKHALLFSDSSNGAKAGDWTPSFLSDWVRAALIVRAWNETRSLDELGVAQDLVPEIVARAEKARYAFEYIIPELVLEEKLSNFDRLIKVLVRETGNESPEASSNFWSLYAGLDEETRREVRQLPESLSPLSDLSGVNADNIEFGSNFSGTVSFFVEAEFRSSTFGDWEITQSDFTNAIFENCTFEEAKISYCDGPILFDNCKFINTELKNVRNSIPGYIFIDCEFDKKSRIIQTEPCKSDDFGPVAKFEGCLVNVSLDDFLVGDVTGIERHSLTGISKSLQSVESKADRCLKSLLKRFFERWAGASDRRQVRDYIRTSSLGRGVWPEGSPTKSQLVDILLSEDFTRGGRQAHIYAPWSDVAGGDIAEREIRSELLAYLQNNEQSDYVKMLKNKIEDAATW